MTLTYVLASFKDKKEKVLLASCPLLPSSLEAEAALADSRAVAPTLGFDLSCQCEPGTGSQSDNTWQEVTRQGVTVRTVPRCLELNRKACHGRQAAVFVSSLLVDSGKCAQIYSRW